MEPINLFLLIVGLIAALVISIFIFKVLKTKCKECLKTDRPDHTFAPPSAYDNGGYGRTSYSSGQTRPSYVDIGRYRVENERSRPRPYAYNVDPIVPTATRPSPWPYEYNVDRVVPTPTRVTRPPQQLPTHPTRVHERGSIKRRVVRVPPKTTPKTKKGVDNDIDEIIRAMQGNLRDDSSPDETISSVQKLLLTAPNRNSSLIAEDCRLVIGVDATPATQAGYCVNFKEKRLSYYVVKREDLPWVLHNPKDTSEFEMKNFMFALTVWEEEILKAKRICIYTDNFAITKAKCFDDKKYGDRAFQVLRHYINCKGVKVLNINNMAVNRFKNLKCFAKYIQPADDLSRWKISLAIEFLTEHYGIDQENVQGTHLEMYRNRPNNTDVLKSWYKPTSRYQQLLHDTNMKINCHDCPNENCLGSDLLHSSLRLKQFVTK